MPFLSFYTCKCPINSAETKEQYEYSSIAAHNHASGEFKLTGNSTNQLAVVG